MPYKCNGVFKGGGIKGIGFAGAIAEFEDRGYSFENVAGTSAGAIAAALVAAGYSGAEIKKELNAVNLLDFRRSPLGKRDVFAQGANLFFKYGIYRSDNFEKWIRNLLERKGIRVFADLRTSCKNPDCEHRLQLVASDISCGRMLVLPQDLANYGIEPDSFEISRAIRMSMSIPFYYEPCRLKDSHGNEHLIVDGGMLSNYPIWLLDDGKSTPEYPIFGFKFDGASKDCNKDHYKIKNFAVYTKEIISTVLEASDNYHISESKGDEQRSIMIPVTVLTQNGVKKIKTTDFDINEEERGLLFNNGRFAARKFLETWNFKKWKDEFR